MVDDLMVSVVITTYDHEKYIAQAIDSVLMQKVDFKYEIIIHDDASTDSTVKIIKEYVKRNDEIIKPIFQKENQYSKGKIPPSFYIKHLKGKYVALCEGDDYWTDPYKLSKQVKTLENSNYVATTHNVRVIDMNNKQIDSIYNHEIYKREHIFTLNEVQKFVLPGQIASLVYRNFWIHESNQLIESFVKCKANGDIKLSVLLVVKGNILFLPDTMADHRKILTEGKSWSATVYKKNLSYFFYKSISEINSFIKKNYGIVLNNKDRRLFYFYSSFSFFFKKPTLKNLNILIKIVVISKYEFFESIIFVFKKIFKAFKIFKSPNCKKQKS